MSKNHWMMFGTFAQQRHFTYPAKDTYEGIIINGNMAAYARDGIASFIQTKTANCTYLIDPQTHAFQHNPKHISNDDGKLKKSLKNLVDIYNEPVKSFAGKKPITPKIFDDPESLKSFTKNCIDFQRKYLSSRMEASDDGKYLSFDSIEPFKTRPYALIPPYFYMQETTYEDWLNVNINSINEAIKNKESDEKFFAMIVINQGLLINPDALKTIFNKYKNTKVNGFIVWVDNLAEFEAGSTELKALLRLANNLNSDTSKEVINLHGSYFSVLATSPKWSKRSFTGVCHGPEFGEHRSVVPVGGGIPIARYYIPSLHKRIRYKEASPMFKEKDYLSSPNSFYKKVCDCPECKINIKNNADNFTLYGVANPYQRKTQHGFVTIDYPTTETKLRCLRHYLQRKNIEYNFAQQASLSSINKDLEKGVEEYSDILGLDGVEYLKLWKKVLSDILS